MKIVITGYGAVGKAIHKVFKHRKFNLHIDDPAQGYNYYRDEHIDPVDAVVVCVATPMRDDG